MNRLQALRWLVEFGRTDLKALAAGRPGDLPNLFYDLRRWLELEEDEPLNRIVRRLEKEPAAMQSIIDELRNLLEAIADRQRFKIEYKAGSVILDAARLGADGPRALSYRDANLRDAVLRVALDDIYESFRDAALIRRCHNAECRKLFFAARKNQIYCSHACANTIASLNYRSHHRDDRAARERRRYEARIKTKKGPAVIIQRRPRPEKA